MDGLKPLERFLHQVYEREAESAAPGTVRVIAEQLTPQEFVEHLSWRAFKGLLDGRHERVRPAVERLVRKLRDKRAD